jgi:hypothetical protein
VAARSCKNSCCVDAEYCLLGVLISYMLLAAILGVVVQRCRNVAGDHEKYVIVHVT